MYKTLRKKHISLGYRILSTFVALAFIFTSILPPATLYAQAAPQTLFNLPVPGTMVATSPGFAPPIVRGLTVYPDNPLRFGFLIDTGDNNLKGEALKTESTKLIKYFLASLTTPEDEFWVNLSPYEKDRIIPDGLGVTELGRDMLTQDYLLKQLTASLIYPEEELGREFWERVYKKAQSLFGTTDIPINTFNKVWIVPDRAVVYEHNQTVFIGERHLKVILEEDYLALQHNLGNADFGMEEVSGDDSVLLNSVSSEVIKEVLIPEIEKEVNQGESFANLRQIYNSMILASWYKKRLRESLLGQVYMDKNKTKGIDVEDKQIKEKIYNQYIEAFQRGVYNYIKEDYDPARQEIISRRYFSGGLASGEAAPEKLKVGDFVQLSRKEQIEVAGPESQGGDLAMEIVDLVENATKETSPGVRNASPTDPLAQTNKRHPNASGGSSPDTAALGRADSAKFSDQAMASAAGPKIPLSGLIGLLKELSRGKNDNAYYSRWLNDPQGLAQEVNAFKGKPERLDTLIHLQSSYKRQAAVELVANAIDGIMAENGVPLIGRFGIGAFQSLAELENVGDYVAWTTSKDGQTGTRIIITKGEDAQYLFQLQAVTQGVRKGTSARVHKEQYPSPTKEALQAYIRSKAYLNYRAPIYLNGELINPLEDVLFLNGERLNYLTQIPVNIYVGNDGYIVEDPGSGMDLKDIFTKLLIPHRGRQLPTQELTDEEITKQTKVFYRPHAHSKVHEAAESFMHLQVGGFIIESFETKGYLLPQDLVIELPATADLTEDRQHIQLSPQNLKAIQEAVKKIVDHPVQYQLELINAIAHLLERMSKRDERALDLLQFMSSALRPWRKAKDSSGRYVYLPNQEDFFHLAIPEGQEAVYINSAVIPFTAQEFPGAVRAAGWQSNTHSLWVCPFAPGSQKISFEFEGQIIVNQMYFERHAANPAPLDLEVNPIVTGYEPAGYVPVRRGRLSPFKEGKEDSTQDQERKEDQEAGIPQVVQAELRTLRLDPFLSQRILSKIKKLFSRPQTDQKKMTEEVVQWLRRLSKFSPDHLTDPILLNRVIDTFKPSPEPLKDYTRLQSTQKWDQSNLKNPDSSVLLGDGNLAVTNWSDDSISIINPETGQEVKKLENIGLSSPYGIAVLADGNLAVANRSDNSISIINPETGQEVKKLKNIGLNRPHGIALLTDGSLAVVNWSDDSISIINPETGQEVKKLENIGLSSPYGIAVLADGNLAVANWVDNSISIINPETGREVKKLKNIGLSSPYGIAVLADGNLAVANRSDNSISIINPETGQEVKKLKNIGLNRPYGIAVLADGNLAVANRSDNSISIINPETGQEVKKLKNIGLNRPHGIALLTDGSLAVVNLDDNSISIINPETGQEVKKLENIGLNVPHGIALLTDGSLAVTNRGDNSISILTFADARPEPLKDYTRLQSTQKWDQSNLKNPNSSVLLGNGNLAVTNWSDHSISIINPGTGQEVKKLENIGLNTPTSIALLTDGNLAVTNTSDNSISIINPETGQEVKKLENIGLNEPGGIALLTDGSLAVTNWSDHSISIINPETGQEVKKLENIGLNEPGGIALLTDGNLAVVNWRDNSISILTFADARPTVTSQQTVVFETESQLDERLGNAGQFLQENSIFFSRDPEARRNYLFNLFYLPSHLKDVSGAEINPFLVFAHQNLLSLLDPAKRDFFQSQISQFSLHDLKRLFSFLLEIDTTVLTPSSFSGLFERWVNLFTRLSKSNMQEPRALFEKSISSNRKFLRNNFDPAAIENHLLRMCYLYLRGDLKRILSVEDRIPIEGETRGELQDISLEAVNAVFNTSPEEAEAVSDLEGYKSLIDRLADEDLSAEAEDIEKSIYGQDRSENLLARENVQNARDAILTERLASRLLQEYYEAHPSDETLDAARLDSLISEEYSDRFRPALTKRVNILDALLKKRMTQTPGGSREDMIAQMISEYQNAKIEIRNYIAAGTNEWIFSVEDPVGMDLGTIIGPLLVLDETTKTGGIISEGLLGLGFYTNFADADGVRMTTGIGDGRFFELTLQQESDRRWVIKSFRQLAGHYKGTRLERIKTFKEDEHPDLDAVFVDYSVYRYTAAIQDIDLFFNGKRINEALNLLTEVETPYGAIRFYGTNSSYQRLTRNLLYVEYPQSEEYFALVPRHYLTLLRQQGFVVDLPKGIPLVRTRLTVSQKEKYLAVIQKAMAAACLRAMVKLYFEDGQFPPGLSEDYFADMEDSDTRGVLEGVQRDAHDINLGSLDNIDFTRYQVQEGDNEATQEMKHRSLKYLLTLVEITDNEGRKVSLRGKRIELHALLQRGVKDQGEIERQIGLSEASSGLQSYLGAALRKIIDKENSESSPPRVDSEEEVERSKELRDFRTFCQIVFRSLGMGYVKIQFYEKEESRLADFGSNLLRWNLYHVRHYTQELQGFLTGEVEAQSVEDAQTQRSYGFFHKMLGYITHELSHFYDEGKASHESAEKLVGLFAWRQKELIRRFVRSGQNWEGIISELRQGQSSGDLAGHVSGESDSAVLGVPIDPVQVPSDNQAMVSILEENKIPAGEMDIQENVGGIDFNPNLLDLQIKRDGNGIPLPVSQQPFEEMNIEGFYPVIINVTPVNIPLLLGEVEEKKVPAISAIAYLP